MMTTKDWFLIIGPLLGVLIGGLITSIVKALELRHQLKTDLKKNRIQRLEQLYQAITQHLNDLKGLGNRVVTLAVSPRTTDVEFASNKAALLTEFNSEMLITAQNVVLYTPKLTDVATGFVQRLGTLIDELDNFLKPFALSNSLPSTEVADSDYRKLYGPISEVRKALSEMQRGIGAELHTLLGIEAGMEFWSDDIPQE